MANLMNLGAAAFTIKAITAPLDEALKRVHGQLASLAAKAVTITFAGSATLTASLAAAAKSASNLEEAVNKAHVVFGTGFPAVNAEIERMVKLFGASRREMVDIVSQLGIMYAGVGLDTRAVAGMSAAMTSFAVDVASLQNLSVAEVLAKIQSGLAGNIRPLREIGIAINEAQIEQYAFTHGLAKMGEELTEVQKVVARHYLILQRGAVNVGDAARTHMMFAGQLRELQGRFSNLVDTIGATVIPMFNDLLAIVNRVFKGMQSSWKDHENTVKAYVDAFRQFIADIMAIYDQWGLVMASFNARASAYFNVLVLYIDHIRDVFRAFGTWLGSEWLNLIKDAFNAMVVIAQNAFDNMQRMTVAFAEWAKGGFRGTMDVRLKGLTEGIQNQTKELKLPGREKLDKAVSDEMDILARKLELIGAKMNLSAVMKGGARNAAGQPFDLGNAGRQGTSETVGLGEFWQKIQSGAFEKDKIQKDQLVQLQQINQWQAIMARNQRQPFPPRVQ